MADWYYAQGTVQRGPVSIAFITDSLQSGVLNPGDLVWREGLAAWTPAGQMPELAPAFRPPAAPPPLPPAMPFSQAAPSYRYAAQRTAAMMQPTFKPARSPHASLAITSMVLGLVAFALMPLGPVLGIPALVCGIIALRGMRRSGMRENWGMATAGVVLGIFWTLIAGLVIGCAILWYCAMQTNVWVETTTPPAPIHAPFTNVP